MTENVFVRLFKDIGGKVSAMKKGTKIGWLLIAISIVFSLWVVVSQSSKAESQCHDGIYGR